MIGETYKVRVSVTTNAFFTSECPHDVWVRLTRVWTHRSRNLLVYYRYVFGFYTTLLDTVEGNWTPKTPTFTALKRWMSQKTVLSRKIYFFGGLEGFRRSSIIDNYTYNNTTKCSTCQECFHYGPEPFSSSVGGNSDSRQTPVGATSESHLSNQSG